MVIVFGLHFLGVFRIPFLMREARIDAGDKGGSAFGAYVLGLAFAFGWTPCIGPVLGAILSMAATEADSARGTLMLGIYALGLGLPFLLAAVFVQRSMTLMNRIKRHMGLIEKSHGRAVAAGRAGHGYRSLHPVQLVAAGNIPDLVADRLAQPDFGQHRIKVWRQAVIARAGFGQVWGVRLRLSGSASLGTVGASRHGCARHGGQAR